MQFLTKVLALTRLFILMRQWREVQRVLSELPEGTRRLLAAVVGGEMQRASKHPVPHLQGSEGIEPYQPWSDAAELAMTRMRSDNPQLRVRGVAVWLATVFHETGQARQQGLKTLHRDINRVIGELEALHTQVSKRAYARA